MDQVAADDAELNDWTRILRKSRRGGRGQVEGRRFYRLESSARFSEASQISLFSTNVRFLVSFSRLLFGILLFILLFLAKNFDVRLVSREHRDLS